MASAFLKAAAAASVLSTVTLVGCATMRSDFEARGEEPLFSVEATSNPSFWQTDSSNRGSLTRAEDLRPGALRIKSLPSGATLPGSLVSDFRMEYSLRLEDDGQAMINFRNYFNNRYCLIIQPDWTELRVARLVHSDLQFVKGVEAQASRGAWHRYEIVAVGPLVRVFKDGRLLLEAAVQDQPSASGNIWFESHGQYSFADVKVARISDFARIEKRAAPAAVPTAPPPASERVALAVWEFDNLGVAGYEASLLCDLYADALVKTETFHVLDRSELPALLTEQELQQSGIFSREGAIRIGRLMNARYISTGSVGELGSGYAINVRIIDAESGETVASAARSFPTASTAAAKVKELVAELVKSFASGK
jgi:TolB-like protein